MRLHVYTVYDKAIGAFMQPFFVRAKGEALRSFSDACNDEKSNFYRHAADYTLMFLGEFDDSNGLFVCQDPVRLIGALECLADSDPFKPEREVGADKQVRKLPM